MIIRRLHDSLCVAISFQITIDGFICRLSTFHSSFVDIMRFISAFLHLSQDKSDAPNSLSYLASAVLCVAITITCECECVCVCVCCRHYTEMKRWSRAPNYFNIKQRICVNIFRMLVKLNNK